MTYVQVAFNQRYDQLLKDTNTVLSFQQPISDGVVGVAKDQHQIATNIDKLIADFEKHPAVRVPEEELTTLGNIEKGITQIGENLKKIEENETKITKTIQENHEVTGRGQGFRDQTDQKIQELNITIKNRQEEVKTTEAAIQATRAEVARKQEEVRNAERAVARKRRKKIFVGILTLGVGAIIIHQQLQASKREVNQRQELLNQQQGALRQQQDMLNTARKELAAQESYKQTLGLKTDKLKSQSLLLSRNRDDLNKYRGFLLDLSDSFTEINSCVQRAKKNLEKVIEMKKEANGAGFTPDSAIIESLNNAYSQLNSSWIGAKEQPSLKTALSLPPDANNNTILNTIKGRKQRTKFPAPFEMAPGA